MQFAWFEEQSPNSRAKCRQCDLKILKGEPRLGENSTYDRMPWTKWTHLKCVAREAIQADINDMVKILSELSAALEAKITLLKEEKNANPE